MEFLYQPRQKKLIDSFSYEKLDDDMLNMIERAEMLEELGSDVVVFFMHWGTEYQRKPNNYQKKIAEQLIDNGVDIILGSHPHVIQPIESIELPLVVKES